MTELRSELLYRMTLEVGAPFDIGAGPRGQRLVIPFKGGRFEGPKLRGEVLITGGDWLLHRADGVFELDVRRTLRTDDGHHIYAAYRGILTGSAESLARMGRGEAVPGGGSLFPHYAGVRDRLREIRLAQPHRQRRHRRDHRDRRGA